MVRHDIFGVIEPELDVYKRQSQANPEEAAAVFEKIIKEQNADILHIAFSSGLSGSYNSARLAAGELSEKYPDRKIIVIDSLCASLGEGLLVHKAVTLKEQGHTLEETADWLESNKLHLVHNFTVNDLFHLYRGGRVSKTAAFLGTCLLYTSVSTIPSIRNPMIALTMIIAAFFTYISFPGFLSSHRFTGI